MKVATFIAATLVLLAAVGVRADTLSTGMLEYTAGEPECWISNVGTTTLTFISFRILDQGGTNIADGENCSGLTVAPGTSCNVRVGAVPAEVQGVRCEWEFVGSSKDVRVILTVGGISAEGRPPWGSGVIPATIAPIAILLLAASLLGSSVYLVRHKGRI